MFAKEVLGGIVDAGYGEDSFLIGHGRIELKREYKCNSPLLKSEVRVNRAFSAGIFAFLGSWGRCPRLTMNPAFDARNTCTRASMTSAEGAIHMERRSKIVDNTALERLAYKFFFTQAPTRSNAFSMFSIELATLKRK